MMSLFRYWYGKQFLIQLLRESKWFATLQVGRVWEMKCWPGMGRGTHSYLWGSWNLLTLNISYFYNQKKPTIKLFPWEKKPLQLESNCLHESSGPLVEGVPWHEWPLSSGARPVFHPNSVPPARKWDRGQGQQKSLAELDKVKALGNMTFHIHSFIHSFHKHLSRSSYVSGLSNENTAVNGIDKNPYTQGAYSLVKVDRQ